MEQKRDRLCPSAPLEKFDLEQRREKNPMMLTVLIHHIKSIKEMITYFKNASFSIKRLMKIKIKRIFFI